MAKKMPGVMVFFDLKPALEKLSLSEKGRLLDAILDYGQDETSRPGFDSPVLEMLWTFVAPRIDADRERYREKCDKARENANKRWSPDSCERIPSNADDANSNNNYNSNSNNNYNSNYNPNSNTNPTAKTTPSPAATATGSAHEAKTVENPVENPENVDNLPTGCAKPVSACAKPQPAAADLSQSAMTYGAATLRTRITAQAASRCGSSP